MLDFYNHLLIALKLPQLNHPNIRIKDPENLEKTIRNIIRMGKDKLQVVSDFDRTISLKTSPTSNGSIKR